MIIKGLQITIIFLNLIAIFSVNQLFLIFYIMLPMKCTKNVKHASKVFCLINNPKPRDTQFTTI